MAQRVVPWILRKAQGFLGNTVQLYCFLPLPFYTVQHSLYHMAWDVHLNIPSGHSSCGSFSTHLHAGHTWGKLWASYWGLMFWIILRRKILTNHRQNKGLRKSHLLIISHSWLNLRKGQPDFTDFSLASSLLFSKPTLSIWGLRWGPKRFPKWGLWRLAGRLCKHFRWKFNTMNALTSTLPFPFSN